MSLERPLAPDPYELLPRVGKFAVTSEDVADGKQMERIFVHPAAGGDNVSPQLSWSGFPDQTRSFAVTCFDPDAPTPSGFWHWVVINLPRAVTSLSRGAGRESLPAGATALRSDYGEPGYGGPRPPEGDRPHRYYFVVHAIGADNLPLPPDATPGLAAVFIGMNTLARAILTPTYQV